MKWGFLSVFSRFSLHFPTLLFNSSTWLIWYADTHRIHKHWTSYKYRYPYEYLSLSCKPEVYIIKLILLNQKEKKKLLSLEQPFCCYCLIIIGGWGGGSCFISEPLFSLPSRYPGTGHKEVWIYAFLRIRVSKWLFKLLSVSTRHHNAQTDILVI